MKPAVLDLTLPTLAENLALDEALLFAAEEELSGEVLRFWEWPAAAVVVGASGRLAEEVDAAACDRDEVPIQRRSSGGGTVLLGKGCLLFSLVLDMNRDPSLNNVRGSYGHILDRMIAALRPAGLFERAGTSDLARSGLKVSGSAQQRKRGYLLHHGTLLYDFNATAIGRYLLMPVKQPVYRAGRAHESFVANLEIEPARLKQLMQSEFAGGDVFASLPRQRLSALLEEKYLRDEWTRRR